MKVKWREVFKFLSGAGFAGAVANLYLAIPSVPRWMRYRSPRELL